MKKFITTFLRDNNGVTAIEYGLIAGLIAAAIVLSVQAVQTALIGVFTTVAAAI
ncbi:Flp family type IVb pilin [Paraburkholderia sp.]|uniref:Flp family type IVb pilin n=1 Tax=Paraburkholderia sp. TaxID=1926495 RepID=UPI003D6F6341